MFEPKRLAQTVLYAGLLLGCEKPASVVPFEPVEYLDDKTIVEFRELASGYGSRVYVDGKYLETWKGVNYHFSIFFKDGLPVESHFKGHDMNLTQCLLQSFVGSDTCSLVYYVRGILNRNHSLGEAKR